MSEQGDELSSWRELIQYEREDRGDLDGALVCTLSEPELDVRFDSGYGLPEGKPFTAWTERRVYFPICYDGAESVGSAPRNPCDEATEHQGGG